MGPRTSGSAGRPSGDATRHRLVEAAVEAFAERGFHATTTRDIAARAGMSPAALYVHHSSKESLLHALSRDGHAAALAVVEGAVEPADSPPEERLRRLVHDFTRWHAEHSRTGRIVQYEIGALSPEHLEEVAGYRRRIESLTREVLADGVRSGAFRVDDVAGTALAVLSLGVDVVRWYQPGGARTPQDVAGLYADLALRMVTA